MARVAAPKARSKTWVGRKCQNLQAVYFKYKYGVSKQSFEETVTGNTPLLKLMGQLDVTEKEATGFLKLFEKIDTDHSGTIDMQEFFTFFKLKENRFVTRAFNVLDFEPTPEPHNPDDVDSDDGSEPIFELKVPNHAAKKKRITNGQLSYAEFFISLYNFCSQTHDALVRFSFAVMDADGRCCCPQQTRALCAHSCALAFPDACVTTHQT